MIYYFYHILSTGEIYCIQSVRVKMKVKKIVVDYKAYTPFILLYEQFEVDELVMGLLEYQDNTN